MSHSPRTNKTQTDLPPVEVALTHTPTSSPSPPAASLAGAMFGQGLGPALIAACDGRLKQPLQWFRTDWQRGGALTGYATYETDDGPRPCVVKLPVPPQELRWMRRLQPTGDKDHAVCPDLYAGGDALGGYDLVWVVMERLPHGPLHNEYGEKSLERIADAAARFYAVARNHPVNEQPPEEDWAGAIAKARKKAQSNDLHDGQRWNHAIKALQKKLKKLMPLWDNRDLTQWRHGDLHAANAMSRHPAPDGPALLFDFALTRPGHWVEDAVYMEHLLWPFPDRLAGCDVVKMFAQKRKAYGLSVDPDWPRLGKLRRALIAATTPTRMGDEGDRATLNAALCVLEKTIDGL